MQPGVARASFSDISAGLAEVYIGSVAWGDYDNDGDLDLALAGSTTSGLTAKVYRNDAGVFNDIGATLTGVYYGFLAWGDYDNDGDLDLALAGDSTSGAMTKIYRNDAGVFNDIGAALTGVYYCSLAWGDYDNDGDLDLALAGDSTSGAMTKIYRNDAGVFTDSGATLEGGIAGSLAWGDYDNDGDLDLALTGSNGSDRVSKVYRNDNGVLTDSGAALDALSASSLAWGDYDNDGDLDLALAGNHTSGLMSKVYRNDNGVFTDIGASLQGVFDCSLAWGDYDNDGDLDLALIGDGGSVDYTKVYRNDNGSFTDSGVAFGGLRGATLVWGDYDNDGYLDLAMTGNNNAGRVTKIYRNDGNWGTGANTAPTPPTSAQAEVVSDELFLLWDAGSDTETPAAGLSYNLMIGASQGAIDASSPMADTASGQRRVAALGLKQQAGGFKVAGLATGQKYWWGVQAVDSALAGSTFLSGGSFIFENAAPVPGDFQKLGQTNQDIAFTPTDFSDHLTDEPADEFTAVRVASPPSQGDLKLSGTPLTTGAEIGYTRIVDLTYTPNTDWHGDDSFTWEAKDTIQWSTTAGTVNIGVGPPVVSTTSVNRRTSRTFNAAGQATQEGMGPVTVRGFVWSPSPNPTTADHTLAVGTDLGSFTGVVWAPDHGLHYIRAYATNSAGTSYGEELTIDATGPGMVVFNMLLEGAIFTASGSASPAEGSMGSVTEGAATAGSEGGGWAENPDKEKKRVK